MGNAVPCGARPAGQPKPRPQQRTLLAAGPALIQSGDELVAAVWPYRRLALLRRLTLLPFVGVLYPAWLGSAATGFWGWGSSWAQIPEAALLVLATICLAHALTVLSGHWSVHAHCALTCTPVSVRARDRPQPWSGLTADLSLCVRVGPQPSRGCLSRSQASPGALHPFALLAEFRPATDLAGRPWRRLLPFSEILPWCGQLDSIRYPVKSLAPSLAYVTVC